MLSAWNYRSYFLHTCTYTCVLEYMQTKKVDFFVSIPPLTAGVLRCRGTCSSSHSVCTFVVHVCASIVCTLAYTCISSRSSHSVWRYSSWSSDRRVYVLLWYTRVQHTSMDVYCKTYRYTCTCTGTGSMLFNIGAACMHGRMMIEARGSMLLQYMLPLDWSMPLNVEIWIATCNNIWPYYLLPYSSTLCTGMAIVNTRVVAATLYGYSSTYSSTCYMCIEYRYSSSMLHVDRYTCVLEYVRLYRYSIRMQPLYCHTIIYTAPYSEYRYSRRYNIVYIILILGVLSTLGRYDMRNYAILYIMAI